MDCNLQKLGKNYKIFGLPECIITEKRNSKCIFRCPLFKILLERYWLILSEVFFHKVSGCVVCDLAFKIFRFFTFSLIFKTMTQMASFLRWRWVGFDPYQLEARNKPEKLLRIVSSWFGQSADRQKQQQSK